MGKSPLIYVKIKGENPSSCMISDVSPSIPML